MNDKLHPALAEHAMEAELQLERERHRKTWRQLEQARGLLREAQPYVTARAVGPMETSHLLSRIRASLSQQAEPECDWPTCECALDPDKCKVQTVEPAPAQDEREARALFEQMGLIADDEQCIQMLAAALATRPAQTEQVRTLEREICDLRNQLSLVSGREALRLEAEEDARSLQTEQPEQSDTAVRIYNSGYMAGHHDTVEGQFTDIHHSDMATYHADVVAALVADLSTQGSSKP